ncbi:cyclic pyranopterin phosphate synthase [Desulfofundulus australicus DSM 11792]|uniref:Cyclic pyranopterin monophosphate synthase n=1 Tax=Desulfofundulus australicus DSM 11792 TaxID=1121425 RepID=A0A1M4T2W6_9FIRM|nr:cyclic pyranopterin monophosphate synthase MoaC [Desulfofundulus australicus]MDK2888020.1 cyclic pyranopterin monophosphate synthase [Thermoanaerobacter sp.]SHE38813.1 cyclic pyranopterin phosphate synthase [Desulfofundulus australicus DSM 11792]
MGDICLSHFDSRGRARMVDISKKDDSIREAVARGEVIMSPETLNIIAGGTAAKGDVLGVARLAGIMAAKKTQELIPLTHLISLTSVAVDFRLQPPARVEIQARVRTVGKTGAEMEALTAVSVAALTIYDMCKAVDRSMVIQNIRLISKSGGKSGEFWREGEEKWE